MDPITTMYSNMHGIYILQLFMRSGLPKVITADQGSEFNNNLDTMLREVGGVN